MAITCWMHVIVLRRGTARNEHQGILWRVLMGGEVKWSEVMVMLKLVCSICGVTILYTRCITFFSLWCFPYVHCCLLYLVFCVLGYYSWVYFCYFLCIVFLYVYYFSCQTAGENSVSWRSCDWRTWHRFLLVSLCLKVNAEMIPKIPYCYCMFLVRPPDLNFLDPYFVFIYKHYTHCPFAVKFTVIIIIIITIADSLHILDIC